MVVDRQSVSEFTAGRLSIYLRCLGVLENESTRHISSHDLAERFELNSSQIRKDLATFGEFGVRGVGYEVAALKRHLIAILGLDQIRRLAVVGAGHLGQALADSGGFRSGGLRPGGIPTGGFAVAALFDNDPAKIGTRTRTGMPVRDVEELGEAVRGESIEIGVVTVPASAAEEVVRRCVQAGLKALLNFTSARVNVPSDVRIKHVDLATHLETLSFYIAASAERH